MVLVLHVGLALASIFLAGLLLLSPSRFKLRSSYFLTLATLASGTFLVVSRGAHLVQACLMGLVYLGVVASAIVTARAKLAGQTSAD